MHISLRPRRQPIQPSKSKKKKSLKISDKPVIKKLKEEKVKRVDEPDLAPKVGDLVWTFYSRWVWPAEVFQVDDKSEKKYYSCKFFESKD